LRVLFSTASAMIGHNVSEKGVQIGSSFQFPFAHLLTHSRKSPRKLYVEGVELQKSALVMRIPSIRSLDIDIELSLPCGAMSWIRRARLVVLSFGRAYLSAGRFSNFRLLCSRSAIHGEPGKEQFQPFQALLPSECVNNSTSFKRKVKFSRSRAGSLSSSQ
jgi:hypothetical protein